MAQKTKSNGTKKPAVAEEKTADSLDLGILKKVAAVRAQVRESFDKIKGGCSRCG